MMFLLKDRLPLIFQLFYLVKRVHTFIFRKLFYKDYLETTSYSQHGEDLVLSSIFYGQRSGIYVDVGCNHPILGNNTYNFYLKGWTGVNIDGNDKLIKLFHKLRPLDKSLCKLVSSDTRQVTYYISTSDKVSTINADFYLQNRDKWNYPDAKKVISSTQTLTEILKEVLGEGIEIDLLCIDVEGSDLDVLKGLNFSIYSPSVILIEDHNFNCLDMERNEIYNLLKSNGYVLRHFFIYNCIYTRL